MILAIVLFSLAVYLFIGFRYVAPLFITRNVTNFIRDCPTLAEKPDRLDRERREQAGFAIPLAFIWPFYLLGLFLTGSLAKHAPLTEYELKKRVDERDRRIADLERELGIKRGQP